MYGVVLFAAMASAGPSCHCHAGPVLCCPATCGCCGEVRFFWSGIPAYSAGMPIEDAKLFGDYLEALRDHERSTVAETWSQADLGGRLKMIEQIKRMQPPDKEREPDREIRAPHRPNSRVASNRR